MERAERSWYLEQLGIAEWVPRDAVAPVSDSPAAATDQPVTHNRVAKAPVDAEPSYTGPKVGPDDILASLRAANGSESKQQVADAGSQLADEFTRPPTEEQLKQLASKRAASQPAKTPTQQNDGVAVSETAPAASNVVQLPTPKAKERTPTPSAAAVADLGEPDFSVEEPDAGDLEALFAESLSLEGGEQAVDSGPDSIEKLQRDWAQMLSQAGCLPASLGEGASQPKVIIVTELPANQFDNRQLDQAWRLRAGILKAAKLPNRVCFHASLYSVSSVVKPEPLLGRLAALFPEAIVLGFADQSLEAGLKQISNKTLCLPSIGQMLSQPAMKRKAWEQLQPKIAVFEKLDK